MFHTRGEAEVHVKDNVLQSSRAWSLTSDHIEANLMLILMNIVTWKNLQDHVVASVGAADDGSRGAGRICTELGFLQEGPS